MRYKYYGDMKGELWRYERRSVEIMQIEMTSVKRTICFQNKAEKRYKYL